MRESFEMKVRAMRDTWDSEIFINLFEKLREILMSDPGRATIKIP